MSPNRLDLDLAIEELRDETPGHDRRERSFDAVRKADSAPKPRRLPLKLSGLAAAGLVIAFLVVVPARGGGLAWSEVLRRTQQASNLHVTFLDAKGQVSGEHWRSGTSSAVWQKDKSGRIRFEMRSDQTHFYYYLYRKNLTSPNAIQYGTLSNKTAQMLSHERSFQGPMQTVESLLKSGRAKLVSQEKAEANGLAVQRYVLKMDGHNTEIFDADPKTARILSIRLPGGEVDRFEYPESIDPKVFAFENRLTRDVAILDLRGKENPKEIPPFMPEPIASKGGTKLREVSVGEEGDLFVFWTGILTHRPARIIGVKTGTVRWLDYYKDGLHPVQGPPEKRLICCRVTLLEKIGDRVTVRIPTASSSVEFKDVPVRRLRPLKE